MCKNNGQLSLCIAEHIISGQNKLPFNRIMSEKISGCFKLLVLESFVMQQQLTDILSNAKTPWKTGHSNYVSWLTLSKTYAFWYWYFVLYFFSSNLIFYLPSFHTWSQVLWSLLSFAEFLAYSQFLPFSFSTENSMEYPSLWLLSSSSHITSSN